MDILKPRFHLSCLDIQEEQLLKLLETARNIDHQREKLHGLYVTWNKNIWKTIISLLTIRDELRKHSFNSNLAVLSGSLLTLLGSIINVVGSLLHIPVISVPLTIGGTTVSATGRAISAGSHIANNHLSKNSHTVDKIFHLNLKRTENIERSRSTYFQFLEEFKDQLDNLELKYHPMILSLLEEENLLNSLEDLHLKNCKEIHNSLPPTVSAMKEIKPNTIVEEKSVINKYLTEFISLVNKNPAMKKMIYDRIPKNIGGLVRPIIDAAAASDVIRKQPLSKITDEIWQAGRNLQFLFKETSTVMKVSLGVVNAIFLAWGIVDVVNTSISIHRGSDTDQIRKIGQAARKLKKYRREVIRITREIFEWDLQVEED